MAFKTIIKPTLILVAVALVSSLALSHVDRITAPGILEQKKKKKETALSVVLPGYTVGKENVAQLDGREFHYWAGEKKRGRCSKKGIRLHHCQPRIQWGTWNP